MGLGNGGEAYIIHSLTHNPQCLTLNSHPSNLLFQSLNNNRVIDFHRFAVYEHLEVFSME